MAGARIIEFEPAHAVAFRDLNLAWIRQNWEPEVEDYAALASPADIVEGGGCIALAELGGDIVGTCALLNKGGGQYELAKMTVATTARGLGIGERLGRYILSRARQLGARRVYLESNSDWTPAIRLYEKLGFHHADSGCSSREQCNVRMEVSVGDG